VKNGGVLISKPNIRTGVVARPLQRFDSKSTGGLIEQQCPSFVNILYRLLLFYLRRCGVSLEVMSKGWRHVNLKSILPYDQISYLVDYRLAR
jgi:hypothetical protein